MQRLNLRSFTTIILFGIILAVCGPVSAARAADDIAPISPTDGDLVVIPSGSAKMLVRFKTNNGFAPLTTSLTLSGGTATETSSYQYDGLTQIYTVEFTVGTGSYPNSSIEIKARKNNSGGGQPTDINRMIVNLSIVKQ